MRSQPNDELTPLEQTLEGLPAEKAPTDLADRCLAALDEAETKVPVTRPRTPLAVWQPLAAAACVMLMVVGAGIIWSVGAGQDRLSGFSPLGQVREKARPMGPATEAPSMTVAAPAPGGAPGGAPGMPGKGQNWNQALNRQPGGLGGPVATAPAPGGPGGAPGGPGMPGGANWQMALDDREAAAKRPATRHDDETHRSASLPAGAPPALGPPSDALRDRVAQAPPPAENRRYEAKPAAGQVAPWYDTSPERRKITTRTMLLETGEVEPAYKEAVTVIETAGGYVSEEDLQLLDRQPDTAHLAARIPVAHFDEVLRQLRALGRVVRLSGSSQDRTQEYLGRGEEVRQLNDREAELTRKLVREQDHGRQAELRRQLQALRAQRQGEKRTLAGLAADTSMAYLELTITEARGLRYHFTRASQQALPLAMGLALVLVPILVLALVLKRRG